MDKLQLALLILGLVALAESLFILIFPTATQKLTLKLSKNPRTLEKIGVIEFAVALALILLSILQK